MKYKQYIVDYIHGKLNEDNKMILVYGNKIDNYYHKIKNLNRNTF